MGKYFSRVRINRKYMMLFIVCFLIMCYGVYVTFREDYVDIPSFGLLTFYNMQSTGFSIVFYLLSLFVIPNIFSIQVVEEKHNKYSQFLKTRLGSYSYYISNLIANSILTFIFMICMEILLLIFIHTFLFPLSFQQVEIESVTTGLVPHPLWNLILYIPLSALGYTVFSNFIMSLKDIVNNPYVYRGIGIIIGIILSVLPVLVGVSIYRSTGMRTFDLFSIIYLPTILLPGVEGFGSFTPYLHPLLLYGISIVFYGFVTINLLKIFHKQEYRNER